MFAQISPWIMSIFYDLPEVLLAHWVTTSTSTGCKVEKFPFQSFQHSQSTSAAHAEVFRKMPRTPFAIPIKLWWGQKRTDPLERHTHMESEMELELELELPGGLSISQTEKAHIRPLEEEKSRPYQDPSPTSTKASCYRQRLLLS